jgi:acyl-CoA thioester hydrolase
MAAPHFCHLHRVTYADCTIGNHIYYARYLDLLEAARGAFFRELATSFAALQEQDVIFPVIECRLRYKSPARYDDVLSIAIWPSALKRVRLNFSYLITNAEGKPVLEAETFHVCTSLHDKPKRLPADLVNRLLPFLSAPAPAD